MKPLPLRFGNQGQAPRGGVYEALTLLVIYFLGDYEARNPVYADTLCTSRGDLGCQLLGSTVHK